MTSESKIPENVAGLPSVQLCTAWLRRLPDNRMLVIAMPEDCALPPGVDDAAVQIRLQFNKMRDETANSCGKSHLDIVEDGWEAVT